MCIIKTSRKILTSADISNMALTLHSVHRLILLTLLVENTALCQTIHTKLGTIVGFLDDVTFNGTQRQVVKYLGIPYGESTAGVNRFSKPKPRAPFSGVYNATRKDRPNLCPQQIGGYISAETVEGRLSEDCLYLNIYAPASTLLSSSEKYAVMIWIHGGSYLMGLADQYPGDVLSAFNDVITVSINYRLNVFGFFSTGDEVAPGNYGLWDQHLAIQWVHNNIEDFGGDPKKVTIFGGSAGSASVLLQAMYPRNRGLFQRVIAESGAPRSRPPSKILPIAGYVGCNTTSSQTIISCLRAKKWDALSRVANEDPNQPAVFAPVVDGEFLQRSPQELESDPNSEEMRFFSSLDIIYGVTNLESAMFMLPRYGRIVGAEDKDITWITTNITHPMEVERSVFKNVILPSKILERYYPGGVPDIVVDAIDLKYSDWKEPNSPLTTRDMLMDITTDLTFHVSAVEWADAHVRAVTHSGSGKNTFFYEYTYFSEMFNARPEWMKRGADHADEILAVFGFSEGVFSKYHVTSYVPSPTDIRMSFVVMLYWTNFAKSG